MGTRCSINFGEGKTVESKIFRHWDGYPDCILPDLQEFFTEVKRQTSDTRFNDASILASRFVVWLSRQFVTDANYKLDPKTFERLPGDGITNDNYLDFLSVRVMQEDSGDVEYSYFVDCNKFDDKGFPTVTVKERRYTEKNGKYVGRWVAWKPERATANV